ncbi:MAG: 3-dehydroquinate synthase [Endomicrobiaceae bacterium]|nr:3-dehydroquinate synthase [Endomicrobiaceae bacterium]
MKQINLKVSKSYPIVFLKNLEDLSLNLGMHLQQQKVFIVSDTNVAKFYLDSIKTLLAEDKILVHSYVFKAGEEQKTLGTLSRIIKYAVSVGIDRQYTVIALGGGVVGDIAGFFASVYMRGLKYIQVPTTLLAMVDSSVGGKTAVNTDSGKNIVGTFYQPECVLINTKFLQTLNSRHLKNGMAEVIKYAVSFDDKFFQQLKLIFNKSVISEKDFENIIYKSCKYKADIVQMDEKETKGIRELLNFGHTFAHALETITEYKKFLHGEAVVFGMIFVSKLAETISYAKKGTTKILEDILIDAGFDIKINSNYNADRFFAIMKRDKKSISNKIKFVLPKKIGNIKSKIEVDDKTVLNLLKEVLK